MSQIGLIGGMMAVMGMMHGDGTVGVLVLLASLILVAVAAAAVLLAWPRRGQWLSGSRLDADVQSVSAAREILAARFARGEIDETDFLSRDSALRVR